MDIYLIRNYRHIVLQNISISNKCSSYFLFIQKDTIYMLCYFMLFYFTVSNDISQYYCLFFIALCCTAAKKKPRCVMLIGSSLFT